MSRTNPSRFARCGAVAALAVASLAGCSSSDDGGAGAVALCNSFTWDDSAGLNANETRMRAIVTKAEGRDASFGSAVSVAGDSCPEVVTPYLDAVQDGGSDAPTAVAGGDLEDQALTRQLAARGVDTGAVLRLGGAMDLLGIGSSTDEPLSIGAAQRLAVEDLKTCDAVAAGSTGWAAVTQGYVDSGVPSGKATTLATYLRLHFCADVS